MEPLSLKLDWESGGFQGCEPPAYDPEKHEFIILTHLPPARLTKLLSTSPLAILASLAAAFRGMDFSQPITASRVAFVGGSKPKPPLLQEKPASRES
jgi:hypothetical protein